MSYDPTQEVRFAVVMYGGISLAIYMNGVAQELLHAVRATANLPKAPPLTGSELIYRELGQQLFWGREPGDPSPVLPDIQTRIVVDILSGTSAGGINAVFLAKALALKNRDLSNLKQMWLDDGDIDTLLNDEHSDQRTYPTPEKASLLNSKRMYGLLLKALNNMDAQPRDEADHPLADDMDLFVTATDLNGLEAPIELSDESADEKMHRMVFHFQSDGKEAGDFDAPFNRMLAFAARCTSAFPVAFEPMSFESIAPKPKERADYEKFFEPYACRGADYDKRPFADGGILDNKPFSYAIEAVRYRDTVRPVSRNLLFIDPSPEEAPARNSCPAEFNFVENAVAALITLPTYQTIRANIDRINERNRYLRRLKGLRDRLAGVLSGLPIDFVVDFGERDLNYMVQEYGVGYAPCHHLKVFGATDWLARLATRVMGFNVESDEIRAIRRLIRVWRDDHYAANPEANTNMRTENRFLLDFDMDYRLRRMHYIRDEIDERLKPSDANTAGVRAALKVCRHKIQAQLSALFRYSQQLESPKHSPLASVLQDPTYRISGKALLEIISTPAEDDQLALAREQYKNLKPMFENAAGQLAGDLEKKFRATSSNVTEALNQNNYAEFGAAAQNAVQSLYDQYRAFDRRDCLMLPLLSGTGIEETSEVGIFRVSPADATLGPQGNAQPERKLAGVKLGHFGAFLSKEWRQNDIMWGRLDGAERIISSLLPNPLDHQLRQQLVSRAQAAILKEELSPDVLFAWLAQYVKERIGPNATKTELTDQVKTIVSQSATDAAIVILRDLLGGGKSDNYDEFASRFYEMPCGPEPKQVLDWTGRAATIVGDMFKGLKNGGTATTAIASKMSFLGILITQVVGFAIPNSLRDLLARYWLFLLSLASVILIVFGPFKSADVAAVGWTVLGITLVLAVARQILRDRLAGGSVWKRSLKVCGIGIAILLCFVFAVGVFTIGDWFYRNKAWFVDTVHKIL